MRKRPFVEISAHVKDTLVVKINQEHSTTAQFQRINPHNQTTPSDEVARSSRGRVKCACQTHKIAIVTVYNHLLDYFSCLQSTGSERPKKYARTRTAAQKRADSHPCVTSTSGCFFFFCMKMFYKFSKHKYFNWSLILGTFACYVLYNYFFFSVM